MKFTKEFIAEKRKIIYDSDNATGYSRVVSIAFGALYAIERLQARVQELEEQLSCTPPESERE